jgi:polyisoprenyl-phosphate glycosyltransferase
MKNNDLLVSVIAPFYNEEECIEEYLNKTLEVLKKHFKNYEIVLVDDGSEDESVNIVKSKQKSEHNIRLIRLTRNYGREIAMTAGFENCIGDVAIVMDADLQDPPEIIPSMVDKLRDGVFDICYAARASRQGESWFKKLSSKLFYKICSSLTGFKIPDNAGDYRAMTRRVINSIVKVKEKVRYMKMLYAYVGFKTTSVKFERKARLKGETKYNYFTLLDSAIDAIVSNSSKPLRYISVSSMILSFTLFILSFKSIIDKFLVKDIISGWASLFFITTLMFSILFIFLAVFAEYLSRILIESKDRPLYYLLEEQSGTHLIDELNITEDL